MMTNINGILNVYAYICTYAQLTNAQWGLTILEGINKLKYRGKKRWCIVCSFPSPGCLIQHCRPASLLSIEHHLAAGILLQAVVFWLPNLLFVNCSSPVNILPSLEATTRPAVSSPPLSSATASPSPCASFCVLHSSPHTLNLASCMLITGNPPLKVPLMQPLLVGHRWFFAATSLLTKHWAITTRRLKL